MPHIESMLWNSALFLRQVMMWLSDSHLPGELRAPWFARVDGFHNLRIVILYAAAINLLDPTILDCLLDRYSLHRVWMHHLQYQALEHWFCDSREDWPTVRKLIGVGDASIWMALAKLLPALEKLGKVLVWIITVGWRPWIPFVNHTDEDDSAGPYVKRTRVIISCIES